MYNAMIGNLACLCPAHLQARVCLAAPVLEAPEQHSHVLVGHLLLLMQTFGLLRDSRQAHMCFQSRMHLNTNTHRELQAQAQPIADVWFL